MLKLPPTVQENHSLIQASAAAKADRIEQLKHDRALLVDALKDLSTNIDLEPSQLNYVNSLLKKVVSTSHHDTFSDLAPTGF